MVTNHEALLKGANLDNSPMSSNLAKNENILRNMFNHCSDIVIRPIYQQQHHHILILYIDGLVDEKLLSESVLQPLLCSCDPQTLQVMELSIDSFSPEVISTGQMQSAFTIEELVQGILKGSIAILMDGVAQGWLAEARNFEKRAIEEPSTEASIMGPKEGFTEVLRVNTSMIRRKLRTSRLKFESFVAGEISQTDVVIAYIEGIASNETVEQVRQRVERVKVDALYGSSILEEYIEDRSFSPFPQILKTERPDTTVASLLEGNVAIIEDGTPFVSIVPMTFWSALQSAEDYSGRFMFSSAIRWIRFMLLIISLLLPSAYVATITFHPQLIPTNLLLSIAAAREPSPFPTVVEALLMEFMFEALREAGLRLPRATGSAVSIVGALVIGQAAVQAGIVSTPMVIVIAITGIASFAIPRYNFSTAFRMLRFPLLILGGTFGYFGIAFGTLVILIHVVNLRSFGLPYLTSVAPRVRGSWKDIFIRVPKWMKHNRPDLSPTEGSGTVLRSEYKPGKKRTDS